MWFTVTQWCFFVLIYLETMNKEAKVSMVRREDKRPHKCMYILSRIIHTQVKHEDKVVFAFQSYIPCASGLGTGTTRVIVKVEVTEVLELLKQIKFSSVSWMWGYLSKE